MGWRAFATALGTAVVAQGLSSAAAVTSGNEQRFHYVLFNATFHDETEFGFWQIVDDSFSNATYANATGRLELEIAPSRKLATISHTLQQEDRRSLAYDLRFCDTLVINGTDFNSEHFNLTVTLRDWENNTWSARGTPANEGSSCLAINSDAWSTVGADLGNIVGWDLGFEIAEDPSAPSQFVLDHMYCTGDNILGMFTSLSASLTASDMFRTSKSSSMTISNQVMEDLASLQVGFHVVHTEVWGGFASREYNFPGESYLDIRGAQELTFNYLVPDGTNTSHAHFRVLLLDGSNGPNADQLDTWEAFYSFIPFLEKESRGWQTYGLSLAPEREGGQFVFTGWRGSSHNQQLDKWAIKGVVFEVSIDSAGQLGNYVDSVIGISNFQARLVPLNLGFDDCTFFDESKVRPVNDITYALPHHLAYVTFAGTRAGCCAAARRQALNNGLGAAVLQVVDDHCYVATRFEKGSILPSYQFDEIDFGVWESPDRPSLCASCVCSNEGKVARCDNEFLITLPEPTELESAALEELYLAGSSIGVLMNNSFPFELPNLRLVSALGSQLSYIEPAVMERFASLEELLLDDDLSIWNIAMLPIGDYSSAPRFSEVCCQAGDWYEIGTQRFGVCDFDIVFDKSLDCTYVPDLILMGSDRLPGFGQVTTEDRRFGFFARSKENCCELCETTMGCKFFEYDNRVSMAFPVCILFQNDASQVYSGDEPGRNGEPGYVSGAAPISRAAQGNASVLVEVSQEPLEAGNEFTGSLSVTISSPPTRGSIWVSFVVSSVHELTPEEAAQAVSFSTSLVFSRENWNSTEAMSVTLKKPEVITSDRLTLQVSIQSCDSAFLFQNNFLSSFAIVTSEQIDVSERVLNMAVQFAITGVIVLTSIFVMRFVIKKSMQSSSRSFGNFVMWETTLYLGTLFLGVSDVVSDVLGAYTVWFNDDLQNVASAYMTVSTIATIVGLLDVRQTFNSLVIFRREMKLVAPTQARSEQGEGKHWTEMANALLRTKTRKIRMKILRAMSALFEDLPALVINFVIILTQDVNIGDVAVLLFSAVTSAVALGAKLSSLGGASYEQDHIRMIKSVSTLLGDGEHAIIGEHQGGPQRRGSHPLLHIVRGAISEAKTRANIYKAEGQD